MTLAGSKLDCMYFSNHILYFSCSRVCLTNIISPYLVSFSPKSQHRAGTVVAHLRFQSLPLPPDAAVNRRARQDDSFEGYERQFGVVALVNEMVAGALAVSENGQPESSEECQQLLHMVDRMNRQLRDVMQRPVQMVRREIFQLQCGYYSH